MRQVRKPRQPDIRSQLKRAQTRGGRRDAGKSFGKRKKPPESWRQRLFGWLGSMFSFRRPVFLMSFVLSVLVLVVSVAVSGVVGRTADGISQAFAADAAGAGFTVRSVKVSGLVRTPEESVRAALDLKAGREIFGIDLFAARARLMQLAWVADAQVRRRFPDDIEVRIVEKKPFARWRKADRIFVVERGGGAITDHGIEAFSRLPLLEGESAPQQATAIVEAVAARPVVAAQVAVFQYQSERRWNLVLENGVTVKLPEYDWTRQLDTLHGLIVDKKIFQYDLAEIDMRSKSHFFFRYGRAPSQSRPVNQPAVQPAPAKGRAI